MASGLESAGLRATPGVFDRTAVKVNQAALVVFLLFAFVLNFVWVVPFMAAVLIVGTIDPRFGLFQRFYRDVLRPFGLLQPDPRREDAAPHRFAQGVGAVVLTGSSAALLIGFTSAGWALALLVAVLAAVNLFFGFCAGCFIYLQLSRFQRV